MLNQADRNRIAVNIWTARVIPIVLAGIVGYATYVLVAILCVNYLLVKHSDKRAAIPILVIYFVLFILMTVCFLRLVHATVAHPPYVPLGPAALRDRESHNEKGIARSKEDGIAMGEYNSGDNSGGTSPEFAGLENDPDSPGLELFYTKDVFVCSTDGRPIWCSECCNWKPDRTHHDSSSGRCIRKMDHFCPWVGGPVGENNFKFFIQFNGYTALYCLHLLVVMAIYIHKQITTEGEDLNRHFIAILALATFFGLFTASMAGTSLNLAALNLTQVERLGGKTKVYILAILRTSSGPLSPYLENSLGEITYPLGAGIRPSNYASDRFPADTASYNAPAVLPAEEAAETSKYTESVQLDTTRQAATPASAQLRDSTQQNGRPVVGKSASEPSTESSGLAQDTAPSAGADAPHPTKLSVGDGKPIEVLSARDLKATRNFAVLKMLQPGDNPWDLGSASQNLKSVMGASVLDWLLPIRRSPCCDHESSESHFEVGPKVAFLRDSINSNHTAQYQAPTD